jgi:hypothetical protein
MKSVMRMAIVAAVVFGLVGSVLAEEGENEGRRPRRMGQGQGGGRRGPGGQQDGQKGGQDRRGPGGPRMEMLHRLMQTEEGKALRAEFKKKGEALKAKAEAVRAAIRKDIEGGTKPAEAVKAREAELKSLLKERILLGIELREKMLAIAKQNVDKAVDKISEKMKERHQNRRGGQDGERRGPRGKGGEDGERRGPRQRRGQRPDGGNAGNAGNEGGGEDFPF